MKRVHTNNRYPELKRAEESREGRSSGPSPDFIKIKIKTPKYDMFSFGVQHFARIIRVFHPDIADRISVNDRFRLLTLFVIIF